MNIRKAFAGRSELSPLLYTLINHLQGTQDPKAGELLSELNKALDDQQSTSEYEYLRVLQETLDYGTRMPDRTGAGRITLPTQVARYDQSLGLPVLTTKKVKWEWALHETLMFIQGITNNTYLKDRGVPIWNPWELNADLVEEVKSPREMVFTKLCEKLGIKRTELHDYMVKTFKEEYPNNSLEQMASVFEAEVLARNGIPTTHHVTRMKAGELGPVYGAMWRSWPSVVQDRQGNLVRVEPVDQLKNLIEQIQRTPYSRRLIVSGWNPSLLPDEGIPGMDQATLHQTNILNGKQVLPPCHTLFQVQLFPLSMEERKAIAKEGGHDNWAGVEAVDLEVLKHLEIPTNKIDLTLVQRSADIPIGVPFNIIGYSIILKMLAHCLNLHPGTFHHVMIDAHIYLNQLDGVKEQLSRTPASAPPKLLINPDKRDFFELTFDDFKLVRYDPQAGIRYNVAV